MPAPPSVPALPPAAGRSSGERAYNRPLDYLRLTALVLMTCIHTARGFLSWGGVDGILRTIGEAAPVVFFVALGMTQRRLVTKTMAEQLRRLGWFGLVSFAQSYFMWFGLHWEFFPFLWTASVIVVAGSACGVSARQFLVLGIVILALNGVVLLTPRPPAGQPVPPDFWLRYGPFFPLPWVALVFIGVGLGVEFPQRWRQPRIVLALVVVVAVAAVISIAKAPAEPLGFRFDAEKGAATSAYLLAGAAGTVAIYLLYGWLPAARGRWQRLDGGVRWVSDRLLVATVVHFLSVRLVSDPRWHWSSATRFVRTGTSGEFVLLMAVSVGLLLLLLVSIAALWSLLAARFGRALDALRLQWVAVVMIGGLLLLRARIGLIGLFSYRWLAFTAMLIAALLSDRVRRHPVTG